MQSADRPSLNRLAFSATTHCLTGCSIGEVLGMVIGTALGWGNWPTVVLSTVLAFVFGYLLTLLPLLQGSMGLGAALTLAFASDTLSITIRDRRQRRGGQKRGQATFSEAWNGPLPGLTRRWRTSGQRIRSESCHGHT